MYYVVLQLHAASPQPQLQLYSGYTPSKCEVQVHLYLLLFKIQICKCNLSKAGLLCWLKFQNL